MVVVTAFFTDDFAPITGLSPTLDIYRVSDNTQVVTSGAMTEIAGGYYKYDFSAYDDDEEYVIIADGGATLDNTERYKYASSSTADIKAIFEDTDAIQPNIDQSLSATQTAIVAEIDENEVKIDAIKVDTGNIILDTADISFIKSMLGQNSVVEFTHSDGNNTAATFYFYDSAANANTHDKATGLIDTLDMTCTYVLNRASVMKVVE